MPYAFKYSLEVEWIGTGVGVNPPSAQKLKFFNAGAPLGGSVQAGSGTGGALASADISTALTAMTTDLSTQVNAALPQLDLWISGGG
jgi:hypothetical protein